ncbi:MAG: hypothetical protein M3327_13355 [Actinomycetota bacterium]|nr:hypothetical protein [Actinomycetota bacterium]
MSAPDRRARGRMPPASFWTPGEGLAWVSALVLTLSTLMGWYSASEEGITLSAIGWHTGILGKLVLVVGLAVLTLLVLRAAGVELPRDLPVGMVIAALGAVGTTFVLVRVIEIPDDYVEFGRSAGLWISLAAGFLLTIAGLLKAAEEV